MARRLTPDIVTTYARLEGVAPELALAFMGQESGGRTDVVSPKGAVGAFQLMPKTFKQYMPGGNINDPIDNMTAGLRVIKAGQKLYGDDPEKIAQFYYHGTALKPGEEGPDSGPGTPTTRQYGQKIAARYNQFAGRGSTAMASLATPRTAATATEGSGTTADLFGGAGGFEPVHGLNLAGDIVPGLKMSPQFGVSDANTVPGMPGFTGSLNGQVAEGGFVGDNDVAANEAGSQDYELEKYIRQMVDEELSSNA